jgi:hypothetical protein
LVNGKFHERVIFGMLEDEWRALRKKTSAVLSGFTETE